MEYLFMLGAHNIAANQYVASALKAALSDENVGNISDRTKSEIKKVLIQLNKQESFFEKQDKLSKKASKQSRIIIDHSKRLSSAEEQISTMSDVVKGEKERNSQQDDLLVKQIAKDEEHDQRIEIGEQEDLIQNSRFETLEANLKAQDQRVERLEKDVIAWKKRARLILYMALAALIISVVSIVINLLK